MSPWATVFLLALLAPLAAAAQTGATVSRIGFLGSTPPTKDDPSRQFHSAFAQGLREVAKLCSSGRIGSSSVNLRAAKALGLAIPTSVLARVDHVVEP